MHLLLQKGHLPTDSVHAPLTPQCTPPSADSDQDQSKNKEQPLEVKEKPEYSFVTPGEETACHTTMDPAVHFEFQHLTLSSDDDKRLM